MMFFTGVFLFVCFRKMEFPSVEMWKAVGVTVFIEADYQMLCSGYITFDTY